jgi:hypothetical protein
MRIVSQSLRRRSAAFSKAPAACALLVLAAVTSQPGTASPAPEGFVQTVTNTNDSGSGSLRSAIQGSISHGSGLVTFDIGSGCGPRVIELNSPLPDITVPIIFNGHNQPGYVANDLDTGDDAQLCIILEAGNDNVTNGLIVPSGAADSVSIVVWGIAFSGFSNAAVNLLGGSGHSVVASRFGGTASGRDLAANDEDIHLGANTHDVTIGGTDNADRNIISGATGSGIGLVGGVNGGTFTGTYNNHIIKNLIGVGWTGGASGHFTNLGNGTRGIIMDAHNNEISGNWIGDNGQAGVALSGGGASNNTIEYNYIGFGDSVGIHGNGQAGIHLGGDVGDAPTANTVQYNVLAANATQGVWVEIGRENNIHNNGIFSNGGLGIDLAGAGVLPNDNDGASQPPDYANRGLNYPVVTAAGGVGATATLTGSLESTLGDYTINFYATYGGCPADDNRQGQLFLGSTDVSINQAAMGGDGDASFSVQEGPGDFGGIGYIPDGLGITATATDSVGNTSEYSACIVYRSDTIFVNGFDGP